MIALREHPANDQLPPDKRAQARGMRRIVRLAFAKLVGGLLFLVPIVIMIIIIRQAIGLLSQLLKPLARQMPVETIGGVFVSDMFALLVIVLVCLGLGLFIGTRVGHRMAEKLEHTALRKIPAYSLIKSATHSMTGMEESSDVHAGLAWIEEAWVPAFVIEQHERSGLYTVFVPSAPTPTAGSIYFLPAERVKILHIPVSKLASCIMRLGVDSHALLDAADLNPRDSARPTEELSHPG